MKGKKGLQERNVKLYKKANNTTCIDGNQRIIFDQECMSFVGMINIIDHNQGKSVLMANFATTK